MLTASLKFRCSDAITMSQISTIEIFPIELFRELFEFFTVMELFRTFFGLNAKLDSVILQTSSTLTITEEDDFEFFFEDILDTLDPSAIKNLKLDGSLSYNHGDALEYHFDAGTLSEYTTLRSLTILHINPWRLHEFWFIELLKQASELEDLQKLEIRTTFIQREPEFNDDDLCRLIFNTMESFKTLKTFIFDTVDIIPCFNFTSPTEAKNIEKLEFGLVNYVDILRLLPSMPYVQSIKIHHLRLKQPYEIANPISPSLLSSSCLNLNVSFPHYCGFEKIEYFLHYFPNLRHLEIRTFTRGIQWNGERCEEILAENCPQLKTFRLTADDKVALETFKSEFWKERNVSFKYDYIDHIVSFSI
jgi:hypothetical protein